MSLSSIPRELRDRVRDRDGDRCGYCLLSQAGQAARLHLDHVVPRSAGGLNTLDNLVQQCSHCSSRKSNKSQAVDPLTGHRVPLFHPLLDRWADAFELADDGTYRGRTAVGRATVAALDMNHPIPLSARAMQPALGLIDKIGPMRA